LWNGVSESSSYAMRNLAKRHSSWTVPTLFRSYSYRKHLTKWC